jgi:ElaB/YqjD/DUF883 family membrane-anchored ribosome-binding protein
MVTFLSATAFAVGCNQEGTSQQLAKAEAKTEAAAQDLKDYSYAQKAEYTDKMQGQLTEINRDLDALAAKIEKSSDAAKAEAKPKIEALRWKANEFSKRLDKAKDATESTWDNVKAGSRKAYEDLKDDFTLARVWVSDKIAP